MVIFHSYVKLPEGKLSFFWLFWTQSFQTSRVQVVGYPAWILYWNIAYFGTWMPNLSHLCILGPSQFLRNHPYCNGQSLFFFFYADFLFCIVWRLYESRVFVYVYIILYIYLSTRQPFLIISTLVVIVHTQTISCYICLLYSCFTTNFSSELAWDGHPGSALAACQHAALWEQAGLACSLEWLV